MGESLEYLLPWVKPIANSTDAKRLEFIFADHWINYTLAEEGINKLEMLFNFPKRQRMPNLLIVGPTNNGKSKLVQYFYRKHLPKSAEGEIAKTMCGFYEEMPVLYMQMPPHPDIKRFYALIMDYFGYEQRQTNLRTSTLETAALGQLFKKKIRMIIIDEIHNILAGRNPQQREFLNALRFLGNELKVPIVAVGTKEAYLALSSDEQLENRFEPFILPRWQDNNDFRSLLVSYEILLPLRKNTSLILELPKKILQKTEGVLGEIVCLLTRSAELAILTGKECIDEEILDKVDYLSPTDRRKKIERMLV